MPDAHPQDPLLKLPCPACGAEAGRKCRTVINGTDVGWTHDARVYASLFGGVS